MFGGLPSPIGGHMAVAVSGQGGLMVRVPPEETATLLDRAHVSPMVMAGRETRGWLRVSDEGSRPSASCSRGSTAAPRTRQPARQAAIGDNRPDRERKSPICPAPPPSSSSAAAWPGPRPPRRCARRASTATSCCSRTRSTCPTSGRRCPRSYLPGKKSLSDFRARRRLVRRARRRPAAGHARSPRSTRPRTTVDTARRRDDLRYDKLLLATGRARATLPMPGADADGVHYLRTHRGLATRLRPRSGRRRVGWSSSAPAGSGWRWPRPPAAAASRSPCSRPPSCRCCASLGPEVGRGVRRPAPRARRRPAASASASSEITAGDGQGDRASGSPTASTVAADAVLVGVGVTPNIELAEPAGLDDRQRRAGRRALRTSDPDIFAVGDVATPTTRCSARRIRVEHWANALKQPAGRGGRRCSAGRRRTTSCPTSSPTSTTSAWSTSGTRARATTRSCTAATSPGREFIAFWLDGDAGCWPG